MTATRLPNEITYRQLAYSWLLHWSIGCKEDTIYEYIRHTFWWKGPDSVDYRFTVDSIKGRGAGRIVLLTRAYHTGDQQEWFRRIGTEPAPMTVPYDSVIWSSVTPTTDSTSQVAYWLRYTGPGYGDQVWSTAYPGPDTMRFQTLIRLIKVIGDPTKNNGWDQQAMLGITLKQSVPNNTWTWIDTTNLVLPK